MRDLLALLEKLKEAKTDEERKQIRQQLQDLSQAQARTLPGFEERDLLRRIDEAKSSEERDALITELEQMPIRSVRFYFRWLRIHDIYGLEGWSGEGYDPSKSNVSRDLQLLAATDYGVSDIKNGGFRQFFWNDTGMLAPEMLEWFERSGLEESANILREAMAILGPVYPRSRDARIEFLKQHKLEPGSAPRKESNLFNALDKRFFASLPWKQRTFEQAADRWITDVCGIKTLRDAPTPNKP